MKAAPQVISLNLLSVATDSKLTQVIRLIVKTCGSCLTLWRRLVDLKQSKRSRFFSPKSWNIAVSCIPSFKFLNIRACHKMQNTCFLIKYYFQWNFFPWQKANLCHIWCGSYLRNMPVSLFRTNPWHRKLFSIGSCCGLVLLSTERKPSNIAAA